MAAEAVVVAEAEVVEEEVVAVAAEVDRQKS